MIFHVLWVCYCQTWWIYRLISRDVWQKKRFSWIYNLLSWTKSGSLPSWSAVIFSISNLSVIKTWLKRTTCSGRVRSADARRKSFFKRLRNVSHRGGNDRDQNKPTWDVVPMLMTANLTARSRPRCSLPNLTRLEWKRVGVGPCDLHHGCVLKCSQDAKIEAASY